MSTELSEPEPEREPEIEEEEVLSYIDETVVVFRREAGKPLKVTTSCWEASSYQGRPDIRLNDIRLNSIRHYNSAK